MLIVWLLFTARLRIIRNEMARNISVVQASVVSRTVRAMTSTGTSENSIMESVVARYSGGTRVLCF